MIPLALESEAYVPLKYLESVALPELKKHFQLSNSKGLDILVKALLFESKSHFYKVISKNESEGFVPGGYFFSEFILTQELQLEYSEAYKLKKRLDNFHYHETGLSKGNIAFADLNLIQEYSYMIHYNRVSRIMFDYPIQFYCRTLNQNFRFRSGKVVSSYKCLWCDGFDFVYPQYFGDFSSLWLYLKTILETLLAYNDLIVSSHVVHYWQENNNQIYQYVVDNFQCHQVLNDYYTHDFYGLFFPTGQSLSRKLGLESSKSDLIEFKPHRWTMGEKLLYYRSIKGLKQKELAERSGITTRTIRKMEKDIGYPDLFTIKQVCLALSIPLKEFLQDIE